MTPIARWFPTTTSVSIGGLVMNRPVHPTSSWTILQGLIQQHRVAIAIWLVLIIRNIEIL